MASRRKNDFYDDSNPIDAGQDKAQALQAGVPSLRDVDAAMYGSSVSVPSSGMKIAEPIALDKITPDPIQARQTIPLSIQQIARRDGIAEWDAWHRVTEQLTGRTIDLLRLLRGEGVAPMEGAPIGSELEDPETVKDFLELVGLAASIYRNGLINPISVVRVGGTDGRYQIESGEGRWWAHRILARVLRDKQWLKIAALVMDEFSVWRQADENAARRPLNAVARARQLARLIMDLNREKGATYTPYGEIVKAGESNRVFYAQVADGNKHKIPDGDVERVMTATGLKSRPAIAHYRALLRIPDELWIEADENNWTERKIREEMDKLKPVTFPTGNVKDTNPRISNHPNGPAIYPLEGEGQKFMAYRSRRVQVSEIGIGPNGKLQAHIWHLEGDTRTRGIDVPLNNDLIDLIPFTPATGDRMLYRGKEVEVIDYTPRTDKTVDVMIWHLDDANRLRISTQTVKYAQLEHMPSPDAGLPASGINYSALPASPYTPAQPSLIAGQLRRNQQGKTFEVRSVLNGLCTVVEISPSTGKPMSSAFSMNAMAVGLMTLVETPTAAPEFNKAMADTAGEDETPQWRVGMHVIYEDTERYHEGKIVWRDDTHANIELKNQKGERRQVQLKGLRLASDNIPMTFTAPSEIVDDVDDQAADNLPSTQSEFKTGAIVLTKNNREGQVVKTEGERVYIEFESGSRQWLPEDALTLVLAPSPIIDDWAPPDWTARGKTILHKPTNTIYIAEGTVSDDAGNWYVRVQVGPGEWDDFAVEQCERYIEEAAPIPYTPHPALRNRTGVITEAQRQLAPIADLAGAMGNKDDVAMLRILPVLVPNHILTWINTEGLQAAEERIIGHYTVGEKNLLQALEILRLQTEEALIVARAIADDQQRKRGA